ncbi:helix-turn-helix domain-containing protein [Tenacibaculum sp.]|nr:helix-turn-helix domain-containing protein [Tenacibaculum sp.]
MKIKKIVIILFFTAISMNSQINKNSLILQYNNELSKGEEHAINFCNQLIEHEEIDKKALGFAGKGNIHSSKSKFKLADIFFEKALNQLSKIKQLEIKAYILYLKANRYIESHELEMAINLLNKAIDLCSNNCSFMLEIKLQTSLGRAYSLSNQHIKALEINNISLSKITKSLDYSSNDNLKKEHVSQLYRTACKSINLYLSDKNKFSVHLDSAQRYSKLCQDYSKKYDFQTFNGYISLLNADLNFYEKKYKAAKEYYDKGLEIFRRKKHSKKIEQILFRIAECYYNFKNIDAAESIFLRQINNNIWSEFQLLDNEAQCYFYLSKINEQKKHSKKALNYAKITLEKIKEHLKTKNASNLSINNILHLETRKKEIESYIKKTQLQKKQNKIYLYSLLLFIIITSLLTIYLLYSRNRERKNISKLTERVKQLQDDVSKESITSTSSLTDEKALKLIKKLKKLEKEQLFKQQNYTLNMVAKKLQTNSSYLSKTVNKYLGLTFVEYSNKLKINNIVLKLKEQKYLQNYTIEALAKEAGYKSVNSFNTNFKKLLKITPSQYLKNIKLNKH